MSTWRDSVANKKNMAITPGSERALAPKPVSSTSSMETTLSGHLDMESGVSLGQTINTQQALDSTVVGPERTYANQYNMQAARVPDPVVTSSINSTVGQVQISPSTGVVVPSVVPSTNTVPEFLYQLTKMLTDNNRDIIEWSNGKIEVHNPHKLQTHVLNRYFRHSKFASFQRQLNYFGFRKLAGKGKMAPCSYVNDATTKELGSLLLIKRKAGNEPKAKGAIKKREMEDRIKPTVGTNTEKASVNPVLANILYRSNSDQTSLNRANGSNSGGGSAPNQSQMAIARVAVGKGIRHSFSHPGMKKTLHRPQPKRQESFSTSPSTSIPVQASLSVLESNYKHSLGVQPSETPNPLQPAAPSNVYVPGSLRRDDSLVDLAMIPIVDEGLQSSTSDLAGLAFIDFPWQDPTFAPNGV